MRTLLCAKRTFNTVTRRFGNRAGHSTNQRACGRWAKFLAESVENLVVSRQRGTII